MSEPNYLNSEQFNHLKNTIKAVFDEPTAKKEIDYHNYDIKDKSIIKYFDKSFQNKYMCNYNSRTNAGYLCKRVCSSKKKYELSSFSFMLDANNNLLVESVSYSKNLGKELISRIEIKNNAYPKELNCYPQSRVISQKDYDCFEIGNVQYKMIFEYCGFITIDSNKLMITNKFTNSNKPNLTLEYQKALNYIDLFKYLFEYENMNSNDIIPNKIFNNEPFTLCKDTLDLYHLQSDKHINSNDANKMLNELFGNISDITLTEKKHITHKNYSKNTI